MGMREKLIEVMKDTRANAAWHRWSYEESADYLIKNDVVPGVRCKDCRHCSRDENIIGAYGYCYHFGCYAHEPMVEANDFCSYGERKDNEIDRC